MPEYIERESLIEVLRKSHSYHARTSRDSSLLCRDIRLVKEQPAADVVEVVRCKDCKHWTKSYPFGKRVCWFSKLIKTGNEFCSSGERKKKDA